MRRAVATLACSLLALGGLAAISPAAAAHPGHDHAAPPPPPSSRFQKVLLNELANLPEPHRGTIVAKQRFLVDVAQRLVTALKPGLAAAGRGGAEI